MQRNILVHTDVSCKCVTNSCPCKCNLNAHANTVVTRKGNIFAQLPSSVQWARQQAGGDVDRSRTLMEIQQEEEARRQQQQREV